MPIFQCGACNHKFQVAQLGIRISSASIVYTQKDGNLISCPQCRRNDSIKSIPTELCHSVATYGMASLERKQEILSQRARRAAGRLKDQRHWMDEQFGHKPIIS